MTAAKPGSGMGRVLVFQNRKYTEEDFVIPSQDTKGHSERFYFRVQPGHARELGIILASKKFPFRTQGDIGRLAVKLVIDLLKDMEPMPSVSGQVQAIIQIVRDEEFHQEFMATYDQATKVINRYIGGGEMGQAHRVIMLLQEEIRKMPKGYWRNKYKKELVLKFGSIMKDAGVKLGAEGSNEEEEDDE